MTFLKTVFCESASGDSVCEWWWATLCDWFLGTVCRLEDLSTCTVTVAWVQFLELLEKSSSFHIWEWGPGLCVHRWPQPCSFSCSVGWGLLIHIPLPSFPFPSHFSLAPDFLFTTGLMKSEPKRNCVEKSWTITLSGFSSSTHVTFTCTVFVQIPVGY